MRHATRMVTNFSNGTYPLNCEHICSSFSLSLSLSVCVCVCARCPPKREGCEAHGLELVMLVTPTTPKERMGTIANASQGFVYLVSLAGVTGTRATVADNVQELLSDLQVRRNAPQKEKDWRAPPIQRFLTRASLYLSIHVYLCWRCRARRTSLLLLALG